jgi:hypothetical protein
MKKLIWFASIVVCAAVFSLSGLYAAAAETPSVSEKPAGEDPAAVQPVEPAQSSPATTGCPGMQTMPMKGYGKGYGPWCGAKHMRGWGMGPGWGMARGCGMMGPGCGMARGCDMMQDCPCPQCGCGGRMGMHGRGMKQASPLTLDDAKAMVEGRLAFMGNPNLKMGDITDQGASFEAEILTRDGSLVDKLVIHKAMGWMRSIY